MVLNILKGAQDQVKEILSAPEDAAHLLRITTTLEREMNIFSLVTGTNNPQAQPSQPPLKPAATLMGEKIKSIAASTKPADLVPPKQAVDDLTAKVEDAYTRFADMTAEDILDKEEDLVIRGVAKKAGIKGVSKDNPKKVTLEFVKDIKEKIVAGKINEPPVE